MQQYINKPYLPLFQQKARYFILMGGRGAGRSTVASQFANAKLVADEYFRCAIMRLVLGDIRNSIYREILDRSEENGIYDNLEINDTMMTIRYNKNSISAVGFRKSSGDQKSKLKSLANYTCVIIEEADEIPEEDFMQLDDSLRTMKGDIMIILLLNSPPRTHWIIARWFDLEPSDVKDYYVPRLKDGIKDTVFIYTNYYVNAQNISPQSIEQYEKYKDTKPDHYFNVVRGLVPETVRGKIYTNWQIIDGIPYEARLLRYGLDFGYTNDPTAIVALYKYNDGFIVDEVCFTKGLKNDQIAAILLNQEKAVVVADSAEPKSIDDIRGYDVPIVGAQKKSGDPKKSYLNWSIDHVQQQKISVTRRSFNILKEYNNYSWDEDKEGKTLNEPKPGYDHAMDAIRYAFISLESAIPERAQAAQQERLNVTTWRQALNSTQ